VFVWFVINVPKSNPKELPEMDNNIDIISHYEKFSTEWSLNWTHMNAAKEYIIG
jgi:hypothetical protein